jgi:SAM-dependent methyltransferase
MTRLPDILRCPGCRGALRVDAAAFRCEACAVDYPLSRGIPRFVADSGYTASFGMQWKAHSRTQLDSRSGLSLTRDRFYAASRWPAKMSGELILEAGSGAGRFTEVLCQTGAMIVSMDMSVAVDANAENNAGRANLHVVQGDILHPPFAPGAFDRIVCFGVLQHTSDPRAAFLSLATLLKPGGVIVCDIYRKSITALVSWKYLLRPLSRRMSRDRLYGVVRFAVPPLIPITRLLKKMGGRVGARLSPIVEYSDLQLDEAANRDWAILDTFDMYSPRYDLPKTIHDVTGWLREARLTDIRAERGPNGIVLSGKTPARIS